MTLVEILTRAVEREASDILLIPGLPAAYKISGVITREGDRLLPDALENLVREAYALAGNRSMDRLERTGDDDFSFAVPGLSRFRVNALRQRGSLALVVRVVSFVLPDRHALGIPDNVMAFANATHGLVLITGPAGSGKSTTLACMIDRINATRGGHIITIEDPIEYLHSHKQSLVSQREVPNDAGTFQRALRAALREAPDVIMLGEMRDHETMQTAITAAETGHLLLSSLHTVGAAKTVDRIVDTFPPGQQQQVRIQLSMVLRAVVSQRLVPVRGGGQEPVFEVMTVTPAVQNMIRDGKTHQIDNAIYGGSADRSMLSMDGELERLLRAGKIDRETALRYATNPDALGRRI